MSTRFDWPALMRAGLVGLRLDPRVFWQLTPAELRLMLGEAGPTPGMRGTRWMLDVDIHHYVDPGQGGGVDQPRRGIVAVCGHGVDHNIAAACCQSAHVAAIGRAKIICQSTALVVRAVQNRHLRPWSDPAM